MRTLVFIVAGIALYAVLAWLVPRWGLEPWLLFVPLWLVVAAVNMAVGVLRAGYSFREELPVFLVLFLVPVIATWTYGHFRH